MVDPTRLEVIDTCVGVMHRTAVPIACTITVAITERDRRRLSVQGEFGNGPTNRSLLDLRVSPPLPGDIGLVDHGGRNLGDCASEGALTGHAFTDPFTRVKGERKVTGPLEVGAGFDREALALFELVNRPRSLYTHSRCDVSAGRRDSGDFGDHLMIASGGRRHFDTRRGLCLVGGGVRYSSEEERRCDKHGESRHD